MHLPVYRQTPCSHLLTDRQTGGRAWAGSEFRWKTLQLWDDEDDEDGDDGDTAEGCVLAPSRRALSCPLFPG